LINRDTGKRQAWLLPLCGQHLLPITRDYNVCNGAADASGARVADGVMADLRHAAPATRAFDVEITPGRLLFMSGAAVLEALFA
jgi:hypothetical protein